MASQLRGSRHVRSRQSTELHHGLALGRAFRQPHQSVVRAHLDEHRSHADVRGENLAVAYQLRFTIFEAFRQLQRSGGLPADGSAPTYMGMALVLLGVTMLVMGILSHMHFGRALNERRERLFNCRLLHNDLRYHATPTFIIAFLLLVVGTVAMISMVARALL